LIQGNVKEHRVHEAASLVNGEGEERQSVGKRVTFGPTSLFKKTPVNGVKTYNEKRGKAGKNGPKKNGEIPKNYKESR